MLLNVRLSFELPFTEPVLIFALAMMIFLLAPRLAERFGIPGIIGVILAGALVGPNGLHLLERNQTIVLLGTVGLIYLMFLAGIEIDLQGFRRYRGRSIGFGILSFALPQAAGTALGLALGLGWPSAILLGALLAGHTLLAYPQALRLGIAKNEAVTVSVGGTMIADTAALLVLAVVAASTSGSLNAMFWTR
ncbi:MAG: cation:proton antiporter, partial [Gemmatimonadales bacterium]